MSWFSFFRPQRKITLVTPDDDPAAAAARRGLNRGDWREAEKLLASVREPAEREFFVGALSEFPDKPPGLDSWVAARPRDAAARLIRGSHGVNWAWEARTSGRAAQVTDEGWRLFFERLEAAWEDLYEAAKLDHDDASIYWRMIWAAVGLQLDEEVARGCFEAAVRCDPDHYNAHQAMLSYLCKKWHGSHDAMFQFARETFNRAAVGSRAHVVMAHAHIERWLYASHFDGDPDADGYWKRALVGAELVAAYEKSIGSPQHQVTRLTHDLRNYFAYVLTLVGEYKLARVEFQHVGNRPTKFPWIYLGDPLDGYARCRATVTG
jgi:hypothetical protein